MKNRVANIVRKEEIACNSYISLVRQNAALCGNGLILNSLPHNPYFNPFPNGQF